MVEMQQRATEEHGNKMDPRYCWTLFFPRPRSWCLASRGAFPRSFSPICRRWVRVVLHVYVIPILVPPPAVALSSLPPGRRACGARSSPGQLWVPTGGGPPGVPALGAVGTGAMAMAFLLMPVVPAVPRKAWVHGCGVCGCGEHV